MNKYVIVASSILLVLLVVVTVLVGITISNLNRETELKNQVLAQQKKCEIVFDNTWKIIKEQIKVTDKYKDSFKEIFVGMMQARYEKGDGSLMKWIQESNGPTFDSKLYDKIMNTIESKRNEFTNEQARLTDINREHDVMLEKIPIGFVLKMFGREKIQIKIVTSNRTKSSFESGEDNLLNL